MSQSVGLFDLSLLFRRAWHASGEEETTTAKRDTLAYIERHAGDYDLVAVCLDKPPYERKALYPEYKGQREKPSRQLIEQYHRTVEEIERWGYRTVGVQGWEADDVMATLARLSSEAGHTVAIHTSDKDAKQCCHWRGVSTVDPGTGVVMDGMAVLESEKFGVTPEQIPAWLALVGDKSDNIPGVPGIGAKRAAALLQSYSTLADVIASARGDRDAMTDKQAEAIIASEAQLIAAETLTRLRSDLELSLDVLCPPHQPAPEKKPDPIDAPLPADEPETIAEPQEMPEPAIEVEAPTTAIARRKTTAADGLPFERQLEPADMRQAWSMANLLNESRLFGQKFSGPEQIMAVMIEGRSRGMSAMQSLRGFNVIKGKVAPSAELMVAWAKNHPSCEYMILIDGDDNSATWETKRRGDPKPQRLTYTIAMADRAGYTRGGGSWAKFPATMLRWRCSTELVRMVYPDVSSGFYTVDEVEDFA